MPTGYKTPLLAAALTLCGLSATAVSTQAAEWDLPPITGNKSDSWAASPNWRHDAGNPLDDQGAQWTLAVQPDKNPSLTSPYELMKSGTYVNYTFIWQAGQPGRDPAQQYREKTLVTKPEDSSPHQSRSSAILFKVPRAGAYKVDITGKVGVGNPSAGYALVTVYRLRANRTQAEPLETWSLNKQVAKAFGGYPDAFTFSKTVQLDAGDELATRIQAVNPGPATAGTAFVNFTTFRVSTQ